MRIVSKDDNMVPFAKLSPGDTFVYNGELYIKIYPLTNEFKTQCNIVDCSSGFTAYCDDGIVVQKRTVVVII